MLAQALTPHSAPLAFAYTQDIKTAHLPPHLSPLTSHRHDTTSLARLLTSRLTSHLLAQARMRKAVHTRGQMYDIEFKAIFLQRPEAEVSRLLASVDVAAE